MSGRTHHLFNKWKKKSNVQMVLLSLIFRAIWRFHLRSPSAVRYICEQKIDFSPSSPHHEGLDVENQRSVVPFSTPEFAPVSLSESGKAFLGQKVHFLLVNLSHWRGVHFLRFHWLLPGKFYYTLTFTIDQRQLQKLIIHPIIITMGNENKKGGLFEQSQKGGYQQLKDGLSSTCKCKLKTRIIGWLVCCILGWLLSIFITIIFIIKHNTTTFAVLYSIGQVLNITGSCFLATPATQVKDMFKKSRLLLTLLYLGAIIGTVVLAILLPDNLKALVLIMLIVQIIAYYLYTLSYIPFGQKILKKCCQCILF